MRPRALVAITAAVLAASACADARAQAATSVAATARVQVDGAVRQPAVFAVAPGTRLAEVLVAAMPTADAYPTGAVLTRRDAVEGQVRLKAGLRHGLAELRDRAASAGDSTLADAATAIDAWLAPLPVTGRVAGVLDPRRLELLPRRNLPLADGDRVHYPRRPATVRVVGAVAAPCTLPHAPLRDAADHLRDCAPSAAADRDLLHVVQPDGSVRRLGIAAWNRSPAQALAPGATVVVPLRTRALRDLDPAFNDELARFVATQAPTGELP